jgi:hypothetical protein
VSVQLAACGPVGHWYQEQHAGGNTRMTTLITLLIGMFIGWNLPQPDWARALQDKVVQFLKSSIRQ